jgi:hypothetical protein
MAELDELEREEAEFNAIISDLDGELKDLCQTEEFKNYAFVTE